MEGTPNPVEGPVSGRRINCRYYLCCLEVAAYMGWASWACWLCGFRHRIERFHPVQEPAPDLWPCRREEVAETKPRPRNSSRKRGATRPRGRPRKDAAVTGIGGVEKRKRKARRGTKQKGKRERRAARRRKAGEEAK